MAKRKRLDPAASAPFSTSPGDGFGISAHIDGWTGSRRPAPIAEVSSDAALRSALDEVSEELRSARREGRFVMRLSLDAVDETHLVRDRIEMDEDELASLMDSLRLRGQQTPIEVVALDNGRYGLISGWRRLTALRRLHAETEEDSFGHIQVLVRTPESAAAAYLAMVEENEIRVGLSFYERARIVVQAVQQGIHPNTSRAVQALFASARGPKRSKILSFVVLVEALDRHLRFPAAIPEKLGLALAGALRADAGFGRRLSEALRRTHPETSEAERRVLEQSLKTTLEKTPNDGKNQKEVAGVTLDLRGNRLVLSGPGVTPELMADLRLWLDRRSIQS